MLIAALTVQNVLSVVLESFVDVSSISDVHLEFVNIVFYNSLTDLGRLKYNIFFSLVVSTRERPENSCQFHFVTFVYRYSSEFCKTEFYPAI